MAFWDKREDPWEWKDGKNPKAPPPQEKDEGEVESLLGEIAAWNQERKEEKARRCENLPKIFRNTFRPFLKTFQKAVAQKPFRAAQQRKEKQQK